MVHGMKYSRYWGAIANHSGDAYFDFLYRCDWPNVLNELAKHRPKKRKEGEVDVLRDEKAVKEGLDDGRVARFLEIVWKKSKLTNAQVHALMMLAMAASYDPHPDAPNGFRLPLNLETGEMLPVRWRAWLKHDPINMVGSCARNLKTLRGIYIDYGSRILSKRLVESGIAHTYEEFDDTHSGIDYRMDRSLPCI